MANQTETTSIQTNLDGEPIKVLELQQTAWLSDHAGSLHFRRRLHQPHEITGM